MPQHIKLPTDTQHITQTGTNGVFAKTFGPRAVSAHEPKAVWVSVLRKRFFSACGAFDCCREPALSQRSLSLPLFYGWL